MSNFKKFFSVGLSTFFLFFFSSLLFKSRLFARTCNTGYCGRWVVPSPVSLCTHIGMGNCDINCKAVCPRYSSSPQNLNNFCYKGKALISSASCYSTPTPVPTLNCTHVGLGLCNSYCQAVCPVGYLVCRSCQNLNNFCYQGKSLVSSTCCCIDQDL